MSTITNLTVRLGADTVQFDNVMRQSTRGLQQLRQQGVDMFNATRTPAERYEAALRRLNAVYHSGNTDAITYERSLRQLRNELWEASGTADRLRTHLQTLNSQMASGQTQTLGRLAGGFRTATNAMSSFTPRLGALTGALSAYAMAAGAHHAFDLAADFEATSISMEVMLRDADRAKTLMREIYDYAAKTPFEFPDVAMAAKQLIGYGENANQVMGTIKMLGNVAVGLQIPVTELANVFGRNRNQFQLYTRDINELAGRGVPVIQYLADRFGVATGEVKNLVEQGKVGFADLRAALEAMSAPGGQFAGLTDRLGNSMKGVASTAKDDLNSAMRELGEVIGSVVLPNVSAAAKSLADLAKQLRHPEETEVNQLLQGQQNFNAQTNQADHASSTADRLKQWEVEHKKLTDQMAKVAERASNRTFNQIGAMFDLVEMKNLEEAINSSMRERTMLQRILKQQTQDQGQASKYVVEKARALAPALSDAIKQAQGPLGRLFDTAKGGINRLKEGFEQFKTDAKTLLADVSRANKIIAQNRTPQEVFKKQMEELDELHDKKALSDKQYRRAAEAAKKRRDDQDEFISEGKRLHESLKTPAERFRDELSRLKELHERGAMSDEDYGRAKSKSESEFLEHGEPHDNRALSTENRAIMAGSAEAFRAINRASAKGAPDKQRENREKQMLDIERRMEIVQRQQLDALRNMKVW